MAIIPQIPKSTAEFQLEVQGFLFEDQIQVEGFHIERVANKIPYAIISILDGNVSKQDYQESSSDQFIPGNTVTLYAGTVDIKNILFQGIITTQKIKQNSNGTSLELTVKDIAVKMTVGRKNAYYFKESDDDILKNILSKYGAEGIKADVEKAEIEVIHEEMVQYYCTDWDFLVSRAEATGRLVLVENGVVKISTPSVIENELNFSVVFGVNTYEFEAEMDARNEYEKVTARSWDYSKRELTEEEQKSILGFITEGNITPDSLAEDVIGLSDYLLQHGGDLSSEELRLWAYSKLLRSRLSKILGRTKVAGTSSVKLGDIINISKFSGRFDGPAFVSGIKHEMTGNSTWFTNIQFGYSQKWFAEKYDDIIDKPAAGLLPAVNGLMIGIVTDIRSSGEDGDPEGNFRVQVKMPMVNNDENKGVWARVVSIDAGDKHGFFFRPELGDEVVLGFLDDDPRQPVILGSLFSSKNAEPPISIENNEENYEKIIYTKSGLKLVFNDENETISISSKSESDEIESEIVVTGGQDPSINIMDKNNNRIVMDNNGIVIESGKDIAIKAPKGDINVEALNVEASAKSQIKMEGNGTAEFSSSGSTTLKGSVVQIN